MEMIGKKNRYRYSKYHRKVGVDAVNKIFLEQCSNDVILDMSFMLIVW